MPLVPPTTRTVRRRWEGSSSRGAELMSTPLPHVVLISTGCPFPVDEERVSGDESSGRRAQLHDGTGDVHGFPIALQRRHALSHVSLERRVRECSCPSRLSYARR